VGAALLAKSGRVYTGCNVENASYGLSICAERTAVFKAVSEGERDFEAMAVVTDKGVTPCGACRQVLLEFGEDIQVIVADETGGYRVFGLQELLPEAFDSDDLG
jgi:cytidine deaminase